MDKQAETSPPTPETAGPSSRKRLDSYRKFEWTGDGLRAFALSNGAHNRVQSIQDALDEQAAREYGRWQADLQNPATVIDAENSGPP